MEQYQQQVKEGYAKQPTRDGKRVASTLPEFVPGQMILVKRTQPGHHFVTKALGPFWVLKQDGDRVTVKGINGRTAIHNVANCKAVTTAAEL